MTETSKTLPADEVINKFGGLRPLAKRLDVAASTVQGWKQRGVIPDSKVDMVIKAAKVDGIELSTVPETHISPAASAPANGNETAADTKNADKTPSRPQTRFAAPSGAAEDERRERSDRRQKTDRRVHSDPSYKGPERRAYDRRSGYDRREQKRREWVHKRKFLERWTLTVSSMFLIVTLVGGFLLLPEYKNMKEQQKEYAQMESELNNVQSELQELQQKQGSLSGRINEGINALGRARDGLADGMSSAQDMAETMSGQNWQQNLTYLQNQFTGLATMMERAESLQMTPGGPEALTQSLARVNSAVNSDGSMNLQIMNQIRESDPILGTLMRDVNGEDLKAAAMLLALNKIRDTMGQTARPFSEDLALLEKLAGNDPQTRTAIERLAPYARSGVLSTDRLGEEFQGLAGEIVMAKMRGEDASVRDRALARLDDMMIVRRIDDVQGNSPDAIVARAEKMMNDGNVRGAIAELEKLDGQSAAVARPWIEQAQATVAANDATNNLTQAALTQMSQGEQMSPQVLKKLFRSLMNQSDLAPVVSNPGGYNRGGGSYPGLTGN